MRPPCSSQIWVYSTQAHLLDSWLQTWINPDTGLANNFVDSLKGVSDNPEVVMLLILAVFAGSHSGLAYLRPYGKLLVHQGSGIPAVA